MTSIAWKTDNYKFVGKAFDYTYANQMNKFNPILGEKTVKSVDYELTGSGGYGELPAYDGENLNVVKMSRGFKTIITPEAFSESVPIGMMEAELDKTGICRQTGEKLGNAAAMSAYLKVLRCLSGAFNSTKIGGDGKAWAAADHPVASLGSSGRSYVADPDAGTYSNLMSSALSVSAITTAQTNANRFVTPDGLPMMCDLNTLLVSPENEATAKKICGENSRLYATKTDDVNPVQGEMKYILVGGGNDGFTGSQWAVCDRTLMKQMFKIIYNKKPFVSRHQLDNPYIDMYSVFMSCAVGWGDGRMIIFSQT